MTWGSVGICRPNWGRGTAWFLHRHVNIIYLLLLIKSLRWLLLKANVEDHARTKQYEDHNHQARYVRVDKFVVALLRLSNRDVMFDALHLLKLHTEVLMSWANVIQQKLMKMFTFVANDYDETFFPPRNVVLDDYLVLKVFESAMPGTSRHARWPLNFVAKGYVKEDFKGTGRAGKLEHYLQVLPRADLVLISKTKGRWFLLEKIAVPFNKLDAINIF